MSTAQEEFAPVRDARPGDPPWPQLVWPVPPGTVLSGGAVTLTELDPALDAPALFAALDDERAWTHNVTARPPGADELAKAMAARAADPHVHVWIVRLREPTGGFVAGDVVGTTSYLETSPRDARLEIGYTVYAPAVWGTRVNPETKLLLLSLAFDRLHAGRVQLKTDVRNLRSQRAIARLGARHEGTLRRYQRRKDGSVRDTVLFSVVAEDWPDVRRGLQVRLGASTAD